MLSDKHITFRNSLYGTKAETSLDKAEALNNQFRSVFTSENINNISTSKNFFHGEKLVTIEITTEMVENKILKLKDNKPPGPDEIHPYFLKKLANCLSQLPSLSISH